MHVQTALFAWITTFVAVLGARGIGAQHQPQPLLAQLNPEARNYAAGYGYGPVVAGTPAVAAGPVVAADAVAVPAAHVATAITKTVHYADQPSVVGYAPTAVYKPDLSAYAAASFPQVELMRRFNPVVRPVNTVVPKVTAVEPSVTIHKYAVDVPFEYRPPAAPAVVVQQTNEVVHPSPYYYQLVDRKWNKNNSKNVLVVGISM